MAREATDPPAEAVRDDGEPHGAEERGGREEPYEVGVVADGNRRKRSQQKGVEHGDQVGGRAVRPRPRCVQPRAVQERRHGQHAARHGDVAGVAGWIP